MSPYVEVFKDPSGQEIKRPVTDMVSYPKSRILLVPLENQEKLRVFLPVGGTVETWGKWEIEGKPEKTKILQATDSVYLKGGKDVKAVIIPPSGDERITLVWEPGDEKKEG